MWNQYGNQYHQVNAAGFYSANSGINSWVLSAEQAHQAQQQQLLQQAQRQMYSQYDASVPVEQTYSSSWYPVQTTKSAYMGNVAQQQYQVGPPGLVKQDYYSYASRPQDWQAAPRNRYTDKRRGGSDIEDEIQSQNLYKTELCKSFEETGSCRYGGKCQFAHGKSELRPVMRHPKYKTEVCKTFHTIGTCPYGKRCRFIHTHSAPKTKSTEPVSLASATPVKTTPVVSRSPPSTLVSPETEKADAARKAAKSAVEEDPIALLQEQVGSMNVSANGFVRVTGTEWPTVWNTPAPTQKAARPEDEAKEITVSTPETEEDDDGRRLSFFQSIGAEQ